MITRQVFYNIKIFYLSCKFKGRSYRNTQEKKFKYLERFAI